MSGSSSDIQAHGPPYPLRDQGLGGQPVIIPDVPITAVLLVLYLIFGVIHIKIFKANKGRGHKFIFNGAILGLCKIRIVTMSLRIAWSCHPRSIPLGIAANVFVYVGTIILFMINWFFVQRIVRAQHQRLGWSTAYRVFHRGALAGLFVCLIMLVTVSIWQFFTIDQTRLDVFRIIQLISQTYFAAFCFAPAVLVLISGLIPRHEIDKFGAGRLRVNITILLIAVALLTTGQLFRCVIAWIPQTRARNDNGTAVAQPWYLSTACFYCFNFATEIVVVIMFALVRVDLRFHVPDGSRMSGDYSGRNSRVNLNSTTNVASSAAISEKNLTCAGPIVPTGSLRNASTETVHMYEASIFEDSRTLADSLQYESSTLEVDTKTGTYKVKRLSNDTSSRASTSSLRISTRSPLHNRNVTFADYDAPPVPEGPVEWPLRGSMPTSESSGKSNRRSTTKKTFEIPNHDLNDEDVGDAVTDALAKLEQNSETNTTTTQDSPTRVTFDRDGEVAVPTDTARETRPRQKRFSNPLAPRQRATFPPKSALKKAASGAFGSTTTIEATHSTAPAMDQVPLPPTFRFSDNDHLASAGPSTVRLIHQSEQRASQPAQALERSLEHAGPASNESVPMYATRAPSSKYSVEEARRFSFETIPESVDVMKDRRFD